FAVPASAAVWASLSTASKSVASSGALSTVPVASTVIVRSAGCCGCTWAASGAGSSNAYRNLFISMPPQLGRFRGPCQQHRPSLLRWRGSDSLHIPYAAGLTDQGGLLTVDAPSHAIGPGSYRGGNCVRRVRRPGQARETPDSRAFTGAPRHVVRRGRGDRVEICMPGRGGDMGEIGQESIVHPGPQCPRPDFDGGAAFAHLRR